MSIKKQYVELVNFLESNQNKKVSTILDELKEMCSTKVRTSNVLKDDDKIVAIYCYYHKKYEPLSEFEYGLKKSTATGYNTMCKEGVSNWTKQQRKASTDKELLLTKLSEGDIDVSDLKVEQELIDKQKSAIHASTQDELSFDTEEEFWSWYNS